MYNHRIIWDFSSMLKGLIHYRRVILFYDWILDKKERLIPQTPSIRERSHSYLGGKTTYGGFNSKITVALFFNQSQEKNDTLW
jgi:hypothetical protein